MKNLYLSLYAFHLCQYLDQAPDTDSKEANLLWESLRNLAEKIPFPELKTFTIPTDKNPEHTIDFKEEIKIDGISLTGSLRTFKIRDTYSVDLTLSLADEEANFSPEVMAIFKPEALINDVKADLGKVLWLTGYLTSELEFSIVEEWAKKICPQAEYVREDRLFNCPLYIFTADSTAEPVTLLISFAETGKVDKKCVEENYYYLRNLLWNYNKIVKVEKMAKDCYLQARKLYSELEGKVEEYVQVFSETSYKRLEKLEQMLQNIPRKLQYYSCLLRDLKAHYITIKVNRENFQVSLAHILNNKSADDRLEYWSDFAEKKAHLYLKQIETYINYIEQGEVLFSNLINNIRATTELEQVKNEQKVQELIQSMGIGIAAGAIVASSSGLITHPWSLPSREQPLLPPHPFLSALFLSAVSGIVAYKVTKNIISQRRKKKPNIF